MLGDDLEGNLRQLKVLRKEARKANTTALSTRKCFEAAAMNFFFTTTAVCEEIGEQIASNTLTERKVKEVFKRDIAMVDEAIVSLQAKRAKLQDTVKRTVEQMEQKRAELQTKKAGFEALLLDDTELPDSPAAPASPASPALTARTYQEEARGASPASTTRASSPAHAWEWPASPLDESRTPSPASTEDERERTRACEND
jgi:hypothetical protein